MDDLLKNVPKEKIYYYDKKNSLVIINDDCLNSMKELPDKSVDLVVTDRKYLTNIHTGCII